MMMEKTMPSGISQILISEQRIKQRVQELAKQISQDYSEIKNLYIVGILKGAFIFLADLSRTLSIPHMVDFMALSSYGKTTSSGEVRILMDLREPIEGRHILLVEDILDTGNTLSYLIKILMDRKPASLRSCVLTQKFRQGLPDNVKIDYLGFQIPDVWVVGYGLDFADKYRTLPYIAELKQNI
jgi:hypoxanthine phosphoribosyltransferase